jgi:Ankyrin repeats (3 copies)
MRDELEVAERLLEMGANVNSENTHGCTPLFYAMTDECAHLLISWDADVSHLDHARETPLVRAACLRPPDITETLLWAGAERDALSTHQVTALYNACDCASYDVARLLLNYVDTVRGEPAKVSAAFSPLGSSIAS